MEPMWKSDARLVSEIQNGNEGAFDELYQRYHKLVFFIAYQLTKCEADAEEVKQEVFIKVLRHIHEIKEAKRFKYWLTAITHNECKHLFRAHREKEMTGAQMDQLYDQMEYRRDFLPELNARYTSDMEVLKACLLRLNEEQREVITLKYFAQLSIGEIAELLQVPNGTIKSRLAYAKKLLKSDVESYCREHDITLSFHMESLGAVCALLLAKEHVEVLKYPLFIYRYPILAKVMLVLALTLGGGSMYAFLHASDQDGEVKTMGETEPFDAKEAYGILKHWAHCEVELAAKSESEKAQMRPLYERLKKQGNYYYILLEQYWNGAFE